jgi:4-oxalocrotonate tautomerase
MIAPKSRLEEKLIIYLIRLNNYYVSKQITISQERSVEQKRELVRVLTRETARIMKTDEEKVRILIYDIS